MYWTLSFINCLSPVILVCIKYPKKKCCLASSFSAVVSIQFCELTAKFRATTITAFNQFARNFTFRQKVPWPLVIVLTIAKKAAYPKTEKCLKLITDKGSVSTKLPRHHSVKWGNNEERLQLPYFGAQEACLSSLLLSVRKCTKERSLISGNERHLTRRQN